VYCINCGQENVENAKFCLNCGNSFDTTNDQAPSPNLANNKMAPLPIATQQDSLTGGLTEDDHQTARNFAALALVLVLFSIFGGAKLAPWWIMHSGGPFDYQGEDYDGYSFRWTFGLKETKLNAESPTDGDDSVDFEYSDGDSGFDEVEDLMKTVTNLGYLSILAATFFVYSAFNQGKEGLFFDAGKEETLLKATMVVGVMGFLVAGYFVLNWPEAFEEDTGWFADDDEVSESLFGSTEPDDNDEMISWKPWLGWGAILFSGFLGLAYYLTVKLQ
jgi:hypothetical protein